MSPKSQLSLFRPEELSVSQGCKELEAAVEASIFDLEKAETLLQERLFLLLDCQKNGLSETTPVSEVPAYKALLAINESKAAKMNLRSCLGFAEVQGSYESQQVNE
jgi:sulfur relay (sulfurtransferase) complex TusBCD TusD component (DsrE family)